MENDVIVALATPPMNAALAIIRVSGEEAINLVEKIFSKDLKNIAGNTMVYGFIEDKDTNSIIDEVMIGIYRAPRSYTGENLVEINCHGGMFIVNNILKELIKNGARMAEKGEYTKRAYLNGKLDLIQAEAIHDMIMATSESNVSVAINSLKGKTSNVVNELVEDILDIRSLIEVNIDYPEYDEASLITQLSLKEQLNSLRGKIVKTLNEGYMGKIITDGVKVAIVGKPNVGKSSLLNVLLGEDKAIVTDIAGTTRDVVEGKINLNGLTLHFFDTAGIREATDVVEKIGVNKSKEAIEKADVVLLILDSSQHLEEEDKQMLELTENKKRIIVLNKKDKGVNKTGIAGIMISAKDEDVAILKEELIKVIGINTKDYENKPMLSNIRQIGLLKQALKCLDTAIRANEEGLSVDLVAVDLQDCYYALLDILGKRKQDEIIDTIFSKFCLGK